MSKYNSPCVLFGKSLAREYYLENGLYMLRVWDIAENRVIFCGSVPRIQFRREFNHYRFSVYVDRKRVALLDNGDTTWVNGSF